MIALMIVFFGFITRLVLLLCLFLVSVVAVIAVVGVVGAGVVAAVTAGYAEAANEECQRHQPWPYPFGLRHRDDHADDCVFRFQCCVSLSAC